MHRGPVGGQRDALRPDTVRDWAGQAGFAGYQVLPVDNVFWRFYQLTG